MIIPVWNSGKWLPGCLEALAGQTFRDFRVVAVDNGSTDGSIEDLRRDSPEVSLVSLPVNRGFAVAANEGIQHDDSAYVALLNADTRPRPGWLAALVECLDASPPEVGAVASKMLRLDDPSLVDDAGDTLSVYGSAGKRGHGEPAAAYSSPAEVFSVCAGAALYRRSFLAEVGLFDPRFESYLEDLDLGLRGRLYGYRYLFVPGAEVLHQGHGSDLPRGRYVTLVTRNRLLLLVKNLPASVLLRHWRRWLFGQIYFLLAYRRPLRSLQGYAGFLRRLGPALAERRRLASRRKIAPAAVDALLARELGEPTLRELLRRRWTRLIGRQPDSDRAGEARG